jgi:hypothetical protein
MHIGVLIPTVLCFGVNVSKATGRFSALSLARHPHEHDTETNSAHVHHLYTSTQKVSLSCTRVHLQRRRCYEASQLNTGTQAYSSTENELCSSLRGGQWYRTYVVWWLTEMYVIHGGRQNVYKTVMTVMAGTTSASTSVYEQQWLNSVYEQQWVSVWQIFFCNSSLSMSIVVDVCHPVCCQCQSLSMSIILFVLLPSFESTAFYIGWCYKTLHTQSKKATEDEIHHIAKCTKLSLIWAKACIFTSQCSRQLLVNFTAMQIVIIGSRGKNVYCCHIGEQQWWTDKSCCEILIISAQRIIIRSHSNDYCICSSGTPIIEKIIRP